MSHLYACHTSEPSCPLPLGSRLGRERQNLSAVSGRAPWAEGPTSRPFGRKWATVVGSKGRHDRPDRERLRRSIRRRRDRRWPGRARHGVLPGEGGPALHDPRSRRFDRLCVAQSLGLARAVHAASVRQPSWSPVPGRPGWISRPRRGHRLSRALRVDLRVASPAEQPGSVGRIQQTEASSSTLELGLSQAEQVVVATGPFQVPNVPAFAADLAPDVVQMHSTGYRRPSDVPEGTVVVVGGGNTGFQIAKELSATHSVHLAIGSRQTPLPQRLLGRDLFWWLTKTGLINEDGRVAHRASCTGSRHADRLEHAGREASRR